MKKMIALFTVATFVAFSPTDSHANECAELADECYERCDENWKGDTVFDGAGRAACKTGCAIVEAGCTIASWF